MCLQFIGCLENIFNKDVDEAMAVSILWAGDSCLSFELNLQELEKLSQKFEENNLDAIKKFEKLITDKKDIEGIPATALAMAAQMAISKVLHIKSYRQYYIFCE